MSRQSGEIDDTQTAVVGGNTADGDPAKSPRQEKEQPTPYDEQMAAAKEVVEKHGRYCQVLEDLRKSLGQGLECITASVKAMDKHGKEIREAIKAEIVASWLKNYRRDESPIGVRVELKYPSCWPVETYQDSKYQINDSVKAVKELPGLRIDITNGDPANITQMNKGLTAHDEAQLRKICERIIGEPIKLDMEPVETEEEHNPYRWFATCTVHVSIIAE